MHCHQNLHYYQRYRCKKRNPRTPHPQRSANIVYSTCNAYTISNRTTLLHNNHTATSLQPCRLEQSRLSQLALGLELDRLLQFSCATVRLHIGHICRGHPHIFGPLHRRRSVCRLTHDSKAIPVNTCFLYMFFMHASYDRFLLISHTGHIYIYMYIYSYPYTSYSFLFAILVSPEWQNEIPGQLGVSSMVRFGAARLISPSAD